MSQVKDIARGLSANGAGPTPANNGNYLLYTDSGKLVVKLWTGEAFGDEQLVSSSVRAGSTAAYVATTTKSFVVGITSGSKLVVFSYDEEEEEWAEDKTLPALAVHPSGKLAATLWQDTVRVVFQGAGGELTYLSKPAAGGAWATTQLAKAAQPLAGTALSFSHPGGDVFYVSAADQYIHGLYEAEKWADSVAAPTPVGVLKQMFVSTGGTKETVEAFGLTEESAVLQVPAVGEKVVLGDVKADGTFVSKVKAECVNQNQNCVIA
ncbi:uncharacterized protein B0H18DRAFT_1014801 [Fomitopsis serialis]|uniref:uncharacterized protein n=1 Tax=Fomitopsis serialis TaxID=139415 RepID=UPI00200782E1|nr:uncharacterized protein B0H18DRAFT_1014801 [Neoantrodia serialis]KAH9923494.1 hypothetical protein B0H18DRAFT_1014801 [Neoantrodia serialis]